MRQSHAFVLYMSSLSYTQSSDPRKGGDGFGSVHHRPTEPIDEGDAIRIRAEYATSRSAMAAPPRTGLSTSVFYSWLQRAYLESVNAIRETGK
jgi:hypothetical protein